MDKTKLVFLASAIIIEIAAIILIVKAISTDTSPTQGVIFLAIGLVFLIIGLIKKPKNADTESK